MRKETVFGMMKRTREMRCHILKNACVSNAMLMFFSITQIPDSFEQVKPPLHIRDICISIGLRSHWNRLVASRAGSGTVILSMFRSDSLVWLCKQPPSLCSHKVQKFQAFRLHRTGTACHPYTLHVNPLQCIDAASHNRALHLDNWNEERQKVRAFGRRNICKLTNKCM